MITEELHNHALNESYKSANNYFTEVLYKQDIGACGFAWVTVPCDGRSQIAKILKKIGYDKHWNKGYYFWNPSRFNCQNIDTLIVGAHAYVTEIIKNIPNFQIFVESRLD